MTLIKANYDLYVYKRRSDLILTDHLVNPLPEDMLDALHQLNLFHHIYIIDDNKITLKTGEKLKKLFTYRSKILKYVEEEFRKNGLNSYNKTYAEIFVFLDYSAISHYFMIKKFPINLIEDGMDIYITYHENWRIYLNYLFGFPRKFALSKYIKNVWILHPERLPKTLKHKAIYYNIKKYKKIIDTKFIKNIMNIYIPNKKNTIDKIIYKIKNKKIFLLLTQSYSEFGHMTEEKKIHIYKQIIKKYAKQDHYIVIKTHPKEQTDYHKIFPKYIIIPGAIPMEILSEFFPSIDIAISINSTAVTNINSKKNIMTNGEFNEEGWEKYMKQLNVL